MFNDWFSGELLSWYLQSVHKKRIDHAGTCLLRLKYLPVVVRQHLHEWVRFLRYLAQHALPLPASYHQPEVQHYLLVRFPTGSASRRRGIRASLRIFLDMDEHGRFPRRRTPPQRLPNALFQQAVPAYLNFVQHQRGLSAKTVRKRTFQLSCFTDYLARVGFSTWNVVPPSALRAFLVTQLSGLTPATRLSYASTLRSFHRWAFLDGLLEHDLSGAAATNKRVNGQPKIVRTVYLGSAKDLIAAVLDKQQAQVPQPYAVAIASFGDVVALCDLAQQIGLVELLDHHLPKRDQGLSVGQYLLLAALNRAVHPTSKLQLADWYRQTTLPRLLPATAQQLSSQTFWNHFDGVTEAHIEAIERDLSQRLIAQFQLSLRTLAYDGTNFFTFIDTRTAAELPQRGHNKQKRNDLRQVSLGLLVSTDFHVPLFHKVYAGNVPDCTVFQTITEELSVRYRELARHCEHITLIFDKGNNSQEAFTTLDGTDFHFIGSLVPSYHTDLLEVPARRYQPLPGERLHEVRAYRTKKAVFGQERTIVVTHNDNLLQGQLQGLAAALDKARSKLRDLQTKLRRRREGRTRSGKAPTAASIRKQAQEALTGQHVKSVLRFEVTEGAVPTLTFSTDQTALSRVIDKYLGKTILFTDNDDWTTEDIVLGYRSQHHIEDAFRQMKHPHYLGWQPMFHWTDSKIRVHAFTCVLALTLSSLLQRSLSQQGLDLSLPRMFELLAGIRETLVIYPKKQGQHHPATARALSTLSAEQEQLVAALDLRRYL